MDGETWNAIIAGLPRPHLLQTWEWGQVKSAGWTVQPQVWRGDNGQPIAAALVLERAAFLIPGLPLRVLYVPRGPLLDWSNAEARRTALDGLQRLARQRGAIFVKIDAEVPVGTGVPGTETEHEDPVGQALTGELLGRGWLFSPEQVQFRNTVLIDLRADEATLLARMKQKTRYNLRLAEKKGVQVRVGTLDDLPQLYRIYAETSVRDGFVIRPEGYYVQVWRLFMERGMAQPLIAEVEGEPVAGLVLFWFGGTAWYMHGMSREAHREKMPNYLLQWEAMRQAKAAGCERYDLWGAPDEFNPSDSMWGVFRFKEGLGGEVVRTIGAWDYPVHPRLYRAYTQLLPRLLDWMRRRGQERTRQEVSR
jgi:lipid II:glycine glycyltransferase (peptidoglycan interpeptide bridge formation enzyme)